MKCINCKYLSVDNSALNFSSPFCNAVNKQIPAGFVNRERKRGEKGMCKTAHLEALENDASRRGKSVGVLS